MEEWKVYAPESLLNEEQRIDVDDFGRLGDDFDDIF